LTRVKICGVTDVPYARAAIDAGADLMGVVFAASPRRVTHQRAQEIAAIAKERKVPVVGVFVNTPAADVNTVAAFCGLDMVQLSGDENWEDCLKIDKPLIKAIHISSELGEKELLAQLEEGERRLGAGHAVYLLDTIIDHRYGGTGRSFAWEIARQAASRFPLIIAGGLHPGNVGQVVANLQPWGVDVSSGVETGGVKDAGKITTFVAAARSAT